jgi:hypothetical protein
MMADRRDPKPTRMETLRQQRAFLFAFVYELIARGYGRDAPLDIRAVADEQQKRRVA